MLGLQSTRLKKDEGHALAANTLAPNHSQLLENTANYSDYKIAVASLRLW